MKFEGFLERIGLGTRRGRNPKGQIQDKFVRIEDKHLMPRALQTTFVTLLNKHMEPCYFHAETMFNQIESVYFDSDELLFFVQGLQENPIRTKLRIRSYLPNGSRGGDGTSFLEIKSNHRGISKKKRILIGPDEKLHLNMGRTISLSNWLISANQNISLRMLAKRLDEVNGLIEKHGLRPRIEIVYRRQAFEEGSLRVTLDTDVEFRVLDRSIDHIYQVKAVDMSRLYAKNHDVVVEIKHQKKIPEWLDHFIGSAGFSVNYFSKYIWALGSVMGEGLKNRSLEHQTFEHGGIG